MKSKVLVVEVEILREVSNDGQDDVSRKALQNLHPFGRGSVASIVEPVSHDMGKH